MPAEKIEKKQAWQEALSQLITDPKELLTLLELPDDLVDAANHAARLFPLKVTRQFVNRIEKGNVNDPLLKQVLPLALELDEVVGYSQDPLQEAKANPVSGILHKYHGRILVTLTSACAIHCRYCFRRHFPYAENNPGLSGWEKIFSYIEKDETITEVILSGGDPLAVSDKLLKLFSDQLQRISHVKRLRIHTRLPIVLPERITDEFIEWLAQLKLDPVIVVHVNHANEIDNDVKNVLLKLHQAGITLLNQSVLLKGVNDDVATLVNLSETLFAAGVLPYYLHVLDKVQGAAHFDMPLDKARRLHKELATKLPGYLVPRLVQESPNQPYKTFVSL